MDYPLISVIVPVYKAEKYLDACVESLVNQTYKNLEILLIDDGSNDQSPQMCDEWAKKDNRIRVIHKKNGGTSDARNVGVNSSGGKYISFVDNDDILAPCFYEVLFNAIYKTGAELSACDVSFFCDENEIHPIVSVDYKIKECNAEHALSELIKGRGFRAVVWNKLYERNLVLNVRFDTKRLREDEFFTYKVLDRCSKLVFVELPIYYYRQREGSIMTTPSKRHIEDMLDSGYERLCLFKSKYPQLYREDRITFCIGCIDSYKAMLKYEYEEKKSILIKIKKYRKDIKFSFSEFVKFSFKEKIYIVFSNSKLIWIGSRIR